MHDVFPIVSNPTPPRLVLHAALATPLPLTSPKDLETEVADALRWNYTVRVDYDWHKWDELCFTARFNFGSSLSQSDPRIEQIEDHFRLSIDPDPVCGVFVVQLSAKTGDGQNPLHWPGVTPQEHETWIPDRSLARESRSAPGWWLLVYTFTGSTVTQFASLLLEWNQLDLRERQNATLTASVVHRTPEVTFPSPLLPLIDREEIASLVPAATLAGTIERLLTALVPQAALKPRIQIEVDCGSLIPNPPPGSPDKMEVAIPILLSTPQELTDIATFAREVAKVVIDRRKKSESLASPAHLVFSVKLFSTIETTVVDTNIRRIPIEVSKVDESWWS